jgi:hypothetical protein
MNTRTLLAATAATAFAGLSAQATLVAYFPLNEGTPGSIANTLDDVIDDPTHGVTDATSNNDDGMWVNDPTRGVVLSTVNGNRFSAGTQDVDLAEGFTWALWVKSDSVANRAIADGGTDPNGADVIIGSRNGTWNKVQPSKTERWFTLTGYDIDDDTWHHIAYTGDAATGAAFYVDGVEVATAATPFNGIQSINDVMEIGGSSRFTEDWAGLMSDIGIWNERLDAATILGIANGDPILGGPAVPGDTDGDGDVDDADLGVSFANYTGPLAPNTGGKTAADGDVDGDGDVDDADLGASFAAYTGPISPAAVPEPTSLALIGLGGLALIRRRRA